MYSLVGGWVGAFFLSQSSIHLRPSRSKSMTDLGIDIRLNVEQSNAVSEEFPRTVLRMSSFDANKDNELHLKTRTTRGTHVPVQVLLPHTSHGHAVFVRFQNVIIRAKSVR